MILVLGLPAALIGKENSKKYKANEKERYRKSHSWYPFYSIIMKRGGIMYKFFNQRNKRIIAAVIAAILVVSMMVSAIVSILI